MSYVLYTRNPLVVENNDTVNGGVVQFKSLLTVSPLESICLGNESCFNLSPNIDLIPISPFSINDHCGNENLAHEFSRYHFSHMRLQEMYQETKGEFMY